MDQEEQELAGMITACSAMAIVGGIIATIVFGAAAFCLQLIYWKCAQ